MDKNKLEYLHWNEYVYTRTKSIIKERNKENILFLHTALIMKKYQKDTDTKILKSVKPIFGELIEVPISKMPDYAKSLKEETLVIKLNRKEFYRLLQEAQNDIEALFTFE